MTPLDRATPQQPTVFIVLINWNGMADTIACVRSLEQLAYRNVRIVVVDNGSANGEAEKIEATCPSVTVMRSARNLGYVGGNNRGIRYAIEQGADYIWLLNNDATVATTCLSELVDAAEERPNVGLLSPIVYHQGSETELQFTGAVLDREQSVHHTLRTLEQLELARKENAILLWGTALLLRRRTVELVGVLDERYFAYHEDMDYSLRVLAAGLNTLVVPEARVYHKTGSSLGPGVSPVREYLLVRNWYLFWSTHHVGWRRRIYPSRYLSWALERVLNSMRDGQPLVADHGLDGIWDGLRGHWGPWELKGRMPSMLRRFLLNGVLSWHPHLWLRLLSGDAVEMCRQALTRLSRRQP